MSTELSPQAVREALGHVVDPCSIATGVPISLQDMGLVRDISISAAEITVTLCLTSPICFQSINILAAVQSVLGELEGVEQVICRIDPSVQWLPDMMAPSARAALRRRRPLPDAA